MSRILIVDDEASICWAFRESLADEGHHVEVAASAEEGLRIADASPLDALVLDVRLPGLDGLTAMKAFRDRVGPAPIVMMTAFGSLETAVKAMEGGAFDYLVKPFDLDHALNVVKRALETPRTHRPTNETGAPGTETLIGASAPMQDLFKRIALVSPTDVSVLIMGESGTGKELIARAVHRHSARRDGPFLPVCPAALSPGLIEAELFGHVRGSFTGATQDRKGLLELANGGTVFLDEIGDVPLNLQVKLLRAIENREVTPVGDARPRPIDIRIIAATHQPLGRLMEAGQFREDLFFRLSVFRIDVPPLRDRRDDIPALAAHFLERGRLPTGPGTSITRHALDELVARTWTGNVRELRNAIEHAAVVARGQPIRPEYLPPARRPSATETPSAPEAFRNELTAWVEHALARPEEGSLYQRFLELAEPLLLEMVLARHGGNRVAAAQVLGMHRATLRQKLRKYGIS